jgi:RNA 2',3'-cyclic 3'-phosphodiesterase
VTENNTPLVRSFIAVEVPLKTKQELSNLQEGLKQACGHCPARWVAPDAIHLTLKFMGDVPVPKLDLVKRSILQAVAGVDSFDLVLAGLGAFPSLENPNLVWVGLSGEVENLFNIQKRLEHLLAGQGFSPENRPFSPHLTLARVRGEATAADRKRLGQAIGSMACKTDNGIPVHQVSLIKSQLAQAGPIYTIIFSATLGHQS